MTDTTSVWVVTSVWAPNDNSDSIGDYPLSALSVFANLADAKVYAEKEIGDRDLGRNDDEEELEDGEDGEDWEDDDRTAMPLTEQADGNWECRIANDYEFIWVQITRMIVR